MGFLDVLLGRTRQVPPNLDVLFAVPSAADTLRAALQIVPTGVGAVCFKAAEGVAATEADIAALLALDRTVTVSDTEDGYGYRWITCRQSAMDLAALVTDLHAVNSTIVDAGYGASLLCTVVGFLTGSGNPVGLVYLYKRGTCYPFVPAGGQTRDTQLELRIRGTLGKELPIEPDLERWFPIWDAPALRA